MKLLRFLMFTSFTLIVMVFLSSIDVVHAQVCWPQRQINQNRCSGGTSEIDIQECCLEWSGCNIGTTCCTANCEIDCLDSNLYPGGTGCGEAGCITYADTARCTSACEGESYEPGCDQSTCTAHGTITECSMGANGCREQGQSLTFGCWGPGGDPTAVPTVAPTVAGDPGDGEPDPTPTPAFFCRVEGRRTSDMAPELDGVDLEVAVYCDDGYSDVFTLTNDGDTYTTGNVIANNTNCSVDSDWPGAPGEYEVRHDWFENDTDTHPASAVDYRTYGNIGNIITPSWQSGGDCWAEVWWGYVPLGAPTSTPTPTPTSIVRARAVIVDEGALCPTIAASSNGLDQTDFSLIPQVLPDPQTQSGNSQVEFDQAIGGTSYTIDYTLDTPFAGNYTIDPAGGACYTTDGGSAWSNGLSATLPMGGVLEWELGFIPPGGWSQAIGGDVYVSGSIISNLPATYADTFLLADEPAAESGVVSYGGSYDFRLDNQDDGEDSVSPTNRLINQASIPIFTNDWYQEYYDRFGSPTAYDRDCTSGCSVLEAEFPSSDPYYINGDVTIAGAFSIDSGQTIIMLIDGDLTIDNPINITSGGFIAFIVSGDITVTDNVGVAAAAAISPVVEGIYIANGTFTTSLSANTATERFIGKGTFVANSFSMLRDLDEDGTVDNDDTSADVFIFNPELLFTMPTEMQDVSVRWVEEGYEKVHSDIPTPTPSEGEYPQ